MAQVHEMIYMLMTNGEYIYGTNLDIGRYSVKHNCECQREFDHVPPCKLEGQGGYSEGSKAFKYVGKDHDPMTHSHSNGWDYETITQKNGNKYNNV